MLSIIIVDLSFLLFWVFLLLSFDLFFCSGKNLSGKKEREASMHFYTMQITWKKDNVSPLMWKSPDNVQNVIAKRGSRACAFE